MIKNYGTGSARNNLFAVMWIRIRIHLGPWIRIRIQRYKMKGKAEFNQQIFWGSLCRKLYFSSLNLKKSS